MVSFSCTYLKMLTCWWCWIKSQGEHSSSEYHDCLYQIPWQSIQYFFRYFTLDQQTNPVILRAKLWMWLKTAPPAGRVEAKHGSVEGKSLSMWRCVLETVNHIPERPVRPSAWQPGWSSFPRRRGRGEAWCRTCPASSPPPAGGYQSLLETHLYRERKRGGEWQVQAALTKHIWTVNDLGCD